LKSSRQRRSGGLEQVGQSSPDLIILDLVMPGLSGADFLVALNARGYSGPIIVEAKRGSEAMAIDCFRLGATDYLTKPLRGRGLADHRAWPGQVRLRREQTAGSPAKPASSRRASKS
jgi:DNA-binding response OmpR family regulator